MKFDFVKAMKFLTKLDYKIDPLKRDEEGNAVWTQDSIIKEAEEMYEIITTDPDSEYKLIDNGKEIVVLKELKHEEKKEKNDMAKKGNNKKNNKKVTTNPIPEALFKAIKVPEKEAKPTIDFGDDFRKANAFLKSIGYTNEKMSEVAGKKWNSAILVKEAEKMVELISNDPKSEYKIDFEKGIAIKNDTVSTTDTVSTAKVEETTPADPVADKKESAAKEEKEVTELTKEEKSKLLYDVYGRIISARSEKSKGYIGEEEIASALEKITGEKQTETIRWKLAQIVDDIVYSGEYGPNYEEEEKKVVKKEKKKEPKDYTLGGKIQAKTWKEFVAEMKVLGIPTGRKSYEQLAADYDAMVNGAFSKETKKVEKVKEIYKKAKESVMAPVTEKTVNFLKWAKSSEDAKAKEINEVIMGLTGEWHVGVPREELIEILEELVTKAGFSVEDNVVEQKNTANPTEDVENNTEKEKVVDKTKQDNTPPKDIGVDNKEEKDMKKEKVYTEEEKKAVTKENNNPIGSSEIVNMDSKIIETAKKTINDAVNKAIDELATKHSGELLVKKLGELSVKIAKCFEPQAETTVEAVEEIEVKTPVIDKAEEVVEVAEENKVKATTTDDDVFNKAKEMLRNISKYGAGHKNHVLLKDINAMAKEFGIDVRGKKKEEVVKELRVAVKNFEEQIEEDRIANLTQDEEKEIFVVNSIKKEMFKAEQGVCEGKTIIAVGKLYSFINTAYGTGKGKMPYDKLIEIANEYVEKEYLTVETYKSDVYEDGAVFYLPTRKVLDMYAKNKYVVTKYDSIVNEKAEKNKNAVERFMQTVKEHEAIVKNEDDGSITFKNVKCNQKYGTLTFVPQKDSSVVAVWKTYAGKVQKLQLTKEEARAFRYNMTVNKGLTQFKNVVFDMDTVQRAYMQYKKTQKTA